MLRDLVSRLLAESRLKCRVAKSGASWLGLQRREVLGRLIYLFKNSPPQDIGRDAGSARRRSNLRDLVRDFAPFVLMALGAFGYRFKILKQLTARFSSRHTFATSAGF